MDENARMGLRYLQRNPEELVRLLREAELTDESRLQVAMSILSPEIIVKLLEQVPLNPRSINLIENVLQMQRYGTIHDRLNRRTVMLPSLSEEELVRIEKRISNEELLPEMTKKSERFNEHDKFKVRRERYRRQRGDWGGR
jgi:hypothetical protein